MNGHDDFELKRQLDALPRAIEPPAEAWAGIRARLAPRSAQLADRTPPPVDATSVTSAWWRRPRAVRIAALLTLLAVSGGALIVTQRAAGAWHLAGPSGSRLFRPGEMLATGAGVASLTVGTIGQVELDTATRVRLLASRATEHRLALERGTLRAEILAPPRLFVVETPSGTAIDLGCAYTLEVDSLGNSSIVVTAGWVEFSDRGRTALIPAGFRTTARHGLGVGTPVADDASPALVAAVEALDRYGMASDSALDIILREARPSDAVTLWHLLSGWRGSYLRRVRLHDRLAAITPPPAEARASVVFRNDPMLMRLWWEKLPGTLPIVPQWQRTVWMFWLRIAG